MDNTTQFEAYRKLAQETIQTSLLDLKHSRTARQRGELEDVLGWFNRRDTTPFGYGWSLGLSGFNPNVVRRAINRIQGRL